MNVLRFDNLLDQYDWRPIRGCPGRYLLKGGISCLKPEDLAGPSVPVTVEHFSSVPDPVYYARFSGGGLISYRKNNGFIHTLCNREGMDRKMEKLKRR